jgi:uncharacterized membrane protein YgcG
MFIGLHEQVHKAFAAYVNEPAFPRRMFHLVLIQFPPTLLIENLFSVKPNCSFVNPDFVWGDYNHIDAGTPSVYYAEFPVAFSHTKVRIRSAPDVPSETAYQRATREAKERLEAAAARAAARRGPGGGGGRGSGGGGGGGVGVGGATHT